LNIKSIHAIQILDSRGNPTIEVEVLTRKSLGTVAVPSGASTGTHEAMELRDGGSAYLGKGVQKAILNVNKKIAPLIKGFPIDAQRKIDEAMLRKDGTKTKKKLGANAILGVSMACTKAGAMSYNMYLHEYLGALYANKTFELPIPFANVINGGVHSGNHLSFQEFMIVPVKAKSFSEATKIISEIYHELKKVITESFGSDATGVGDEGGFAPILHSPEEALDLLDVAIYASGYKNKVAIAIDAAASEFYDKKARKYKVAKGIYLEAHELVNYYEDLCKKHKIISIEDPFDEDDFESFKELTKRIGSKIQIVGDDLTVSNPERIKTAIEQKACNALLLKVNQIGTITEAMEAAHLAQRNGWNVMVSHRSGETEDAFIADFAVGLNCGQIKLGAPCRGERTAKYNQLLRIEDVMGKKVRYAKFRI